MTGERRRMMAAAQESPGPAAGDRPARRRSSLNRGGTWWSGPLAVRAGRRACRRADLSRGGQNRLSRGLAGVLAVVTGAGCLGLSLADRQTCR